MIPVIKTRFPATNLWTCVLACSLALSADSLAVAAQESNPVHANSVQQFLFSADTSAGVQAEFANMGVLLTDALAAPAQGRTVWVTGTGPSGFPAPYRIDHVGGRFHVYAERRRPQHPVAPFPYVSQEVRFNTPDPGVAPVGTLTYPKSGGSFPAVVLVAGTGAHNRDAGMSLHKTLLVLADHLTRQGFAVLRYDKRGVGLTGGERHPGPTTDDYAADALAAVRFLKMQPNIDPRRIGIAGHSEGGIIAAMVAAEAPEDVGFIVMLAGTGLPGQENQSLQGAAFARADGVPEALILLNQKLERGQLTIAASKLGRQEALDAMRTATRVLPAEDKEKLEIPAEGLPAEAFEALLSPWFRRFLALDPRSYLEKVKCPVLAIVGEKDLQVPPAENLQGIERALERGANRRATVRQLAGVNHNLQTARTGKLSEYFLIEETVAPSVLELLSSWMKDVTHHKD
ncbi:MAG: alpha/beta fold hydrolase [Acidobacteriota bacterium]|nr:alpha/beta fold hydrolase [Acidobacteriota bacterium]